MPDAMIIAGPNGAGKSTILPTIRRLGRGDGPFEPNSIQAENVIDPDQIQKEAAVGTVEAGRLAIEKTHRLIEAGSDLAIETTMTGNQVFRLIARLREKSYRVYLVYLWLPDVELSVARVVQRGLRGRHYIPLQTLMRRYNRSMANFLKASDAADFWVAVDNSSLVPQISAWGGNLFRQTVLSRDPAGIESLVTTLRRVNPDFASGETGCAWSNPCFEEEADPITPVVLDRIRRAILDEIQQQPQECVCVWEEGVLTFKDWRSAIPKLNPN